MVAISIIVLTGIRAWTNDRLAVLAAAGIPRCGH